MVSQFGGPDVLRVVTGREPTPPQGQVAVRVLAAGVSFTDTLLRAGTYPRGPRPPFTPGYEIAGVVEKVGPGCVTFRPGDRIAALLVWGGNAEVVCVPEEAAVAVPDDIDPAVMVSLIFPYVTAYQLLYRAAEAKQGQTVLYHGAAGAVGTALLEIARSGGLTVYGTVSSSDRSVVESLGGIAIDYRKRDFLDVIRSLPTGGVDVAIDGIGGTVSWRSFRALRAGGRLVLFGHLSTLRRGHRDWRRLIGFYSWASATWLAGHVVPNRSVRTYRIARLREDHPEWFREDVTALIRLLREGALQPRIAARLPLTEVRRAHEMVDADGVRGKIVLTPAD